MKTLLCTAAILGLGALPSLATSFGSSSSAGGSSSSSSGSASSSTGGSMGTSSGAGFSQDQLRQALTQSGLRNITILSGGSGGASSSSSSASSAGGVSSTSSGDGVYVVRAEVPNGGAVLITIVPQAAMMGGASASPAR